MKKLFQIFAVIGIISFQACEGPIGPTGPQGQQGQQGPQGAPGVNIVGTTIEVEIDFNEANDYTGFADTPFLLEESDALLVYRLSGVDNNRDVWRLLPQTYFFQEGVLQYNFDYTIADVSIFLDGAIDLSTVPPQWATDQVFRIIVVPSDFIRNRMDLTNYEAVTKMLGITDSDFKKVEVRK